MGARAYLRLARVQTAGVTATVPLYGYLAGAFAAGGHAGVSAAAGDVTTFVLLVAAGVSAHLFGFVHNEIADRAVDEKAAYRRPKPLSAGDVKLGAAWAMAAAGLAAGVGCALVLSLRADFSVLALAGTSAALAALYNVKGKSFPGGDAILAGSIAAFVMAGASAAAGFAAALTPAALGVALLAALVLFFNNAFEGGFKDVESDAAGGKRTLVILLEGKGEASPAFYRRLNAAQAAVHAAMFVVAAFLVLGPIASSSRGDAYIGFSLAAILIAGMAWFYARGLSAADREFMLRQFALHEILAVLLLLTVLAPILSPALLVALFAGPLFVFLAANRFLYGTFASPDV